MMPAKSPISRSVGQQALLASQLVKSLKSPKIMSAIPTMKLVIESVSFVSLLAAMVELVNNVSFSPLSNIVVIMVVLVAVMVNDSFLSLSSIVVEIVVLIHVSFSKSVVSLVELNSDPLSSNIVVASLVVHGVLPHSL